MKTRYSLVVLFVVAGMLLAACGRGAPRLHNPRPCPHATAGPAPTDPRRRAD
jgi:hypothetical protein